MLVFIWTGDSYGQVVFLSFVISILVIQTKSKQIWFLLHKSKKKKKALFYWINEPSWNPKRASTA